MATANAGRISINLSAGTAQFVVDMEKANAKVREMGAAHGHAITGVQATSAALRTLEGNIGNNLRAAENFVAKTLGLGDALKAIFPVVGAIALVGTLSELAKKAAELGEELNRAAEAPKRIASEFQALVQPIRVSNAELQVQNDKLEIAIARLSGRPENTLKLALHETALEAEKLSEAINKDIDGVQKLLEQEQVGSFKAFFTGQESSGKVDERFKKFREDLTDISLRTADQLAATSDPSKRAEIARVGVKEKLDRVRQENDELKKQLTLEEGIQKARSEARANPTFVSTPYGPVVQGRSGSTLASPDANIARLKGERAQLADLLATAGLTEQNTALTKTKERLESKANNAKLDQPIKEYLAELASKQRGAAAELEAALRSTGKEDFLGSALAKGYAEADRGITSLNQRQAAAKQPSVSLSQRADIVAGQTSLAITQAQTQGRERQLQVEKQIAQESISLADKLAAEARQRQDGLALIDEQIDAARQLAAAETQGSDAVFQAQLKIKLARIADPEARAKTQVLDQVEHTAEIQKTVQAMNRETEAVQRQTAAVLGGVQARRAAQLETIRASGADPKVIEAQERAQRAQYQLEDASQLKGLPPSAGVRAYFQEIADNAQSAALQVKNVLGGAFESLNDTLAKIISGQTADWASFFQGLSAELARLAIQEAEMAALRSLGIGGNNNQTGGSGNAGSGGSATSGILGGLLGGLFKGRSAASRSAANGGTPGFLSDGDDGSDFGDSGSGSVASTAFSAVGGFFKKLFGGFKAEGGSVDPGRAYIVGEKGPELFTPPGGGGSITPNRMLGGSTAFYSINASDANSADVEQRVNRSLVAVHGSAIRNSAAVQAEMMRRKPRGA